MPLAPHTGDTCVGSPTTCPCKPGRQTTISVVLACLLLPVQSQMLFLYLVVSVSDRFVRVIGSFVEDAGKGKATWARAPLRLCHL